MICGVGAGPAGDYCSQQNDSGIGVANETDGLDATHGGANSPPPGRNSRNEENFTSERTSQSPKWRQNSRQDGFKWRSEERRVGKEC